MIRTGYLRCYIFDIELSTKTNAQVTGEIDTYKQLVVFWPFSVILCEAAYKEDKENSDL